MNRLLDLLGLVACALGASGAEAPNTAPETPQPLPSPTVLLVVGAPGETEFGSNFVYQAALWQNACRQHQLPTAIVGPQTGSESSPPEIGEENDRQQFDQILARLPRHGSHPLWIILIGHGTFDGKEARFNLRGPDFSASELAHWLQPFQRPVILINTASSSAPFIPALAATNRIVLTATRSGNELNATRFGRCLAEALTDPTSDLDQDGETSLLELFLSAAHRVSDFYITEGRLLTEHALIDDNGDGRGTPAEWFRGLRSTKAPEAGTALDGARARLLRLFPSAIDLALTPAQHERRDNLELQIEQLRASKSTLPSEDYYRQLEIILLELARIQAAPESAPRP